MIERWFEPFMLLERQATSDGMGGQTEAFLPDTPFRGVLTLTCGDSIPCAGQAVVKEELVLLHEFDVTLVLGDHVRRERDGAVYRVTGCSEGMRAPAFSGLRFTQVTVERVVLPC